MNPTPRRDTERIGRNLVHELKEFSSLRLWLAALCGLPWAAVALAAVVAFTAWVDLAADLPAMWRVVGLAAAAVAGIAVLTRSLVAGRRRAAPRRVALDVDRVAGTEGHVAASYDLAEDPTPRSELSEGLAVVAVNRAARITNNVPNLQVQPLAPLGHAFLAAVGATLAVLVFAAFFPRAAEVEWLRLSQPFADHPPFSRHIFALEPGDTKALYGASVAIQARVTGIPVERLDLVVRDPSGAEETAPMFEERSGAWRAQLSGVAAPLTYWVRADRGRSRRFRIDIINTPQFTDVAVRMTPPAYTHRPVVEGPIPQGGVAGLPGAAIRVSVRSNIPLAKGEMTFQPTAGEARLVEAVPSPSAPDRVDWEFDLRESGRISLSLVARGGERSTAPMHAAVVLEKDMPPLVRLLSPKARSYATPDVALPVEIAAEDDCGVGRLQLYRSLNGSRHMPEEYDLPLPEPARVQANSAMPLAAYGLRPGDVIGLFARAVDADPNRPKGAETPLVTVTIISREEYERLLSEMRTVEDFQARYREAARRAEDMAAQLATLREPGQTPEEQRRRAAELAKSLRQAAEAVRAAADRKPEFPLDEDLAAPLRELAESMERAARHADAAATATDPRDPLDAALQELGAGRRQYAEQVEAPLEQFESVLRLMEQEQRFLELYEAQEDLARRMENLKDRENIEDAADRIRTRDLRDEQRAREADLQDVLYEIARRSEQLPAAPEFEKLRQTARAFEQAARASGAGTQMREAEEALYRYDGKRSHENARRAADTLKSLLAQCRESQAEGENVCPLGFQPKLRQAAKETMSQLLGRNRGNGPGYSMAGGRQNVGVYGPTALGRPSNMGQGRDSKSGIVVLEPVGGEGPGVIPPGERRHVETDSAAVERLPEPLREAVRAYFKRVADETAAGALLPDAPAEER